MRFQGKKISQVNGGKRRTKCNDEIKEEHIKKKTYIAHVRPSLSHHSVKKINGAETEELPPRLSSEPRITLLRFHRIPFCLPSPTFFTTFPFFFFFCSKLMLLDSSSTHIAFSFIRMLLGLVFVRTSRAVPLL